MTTKKNTPTSFVCGWCTNGFHDKCRVQHCTCAAVDHVSDEYVPPAKVAAR